MNIPPSLNLKPTLLLGPGPSDAHPSVLRTMATPLLGHLDPQFLNIMNEVQGMLRAALLTKNPLTLPISATGTAGMETCLVNLLEPGDKAAVFALGYFGQRMIDIAGRTGAEVTAVQGKWGEAFDLQLVRDTLRRVRPKLLAIVHAETSTGVLQPGMDEIGQMCRETDTLLMADCVTSLGCTELKVDEWGIDAVFSCSQKGLSCPPGLSPVSFSPRAVEAMERRKTKVQSWYLDLALIRQYLGGAQRAYHHTAPISMNFALHEGLAPGAARRAGSAVGTAPEEPRGPEGGLAGDGAAVHGGGRLPLAAAQRRPHPGGDGRRGGTEDDAGRVRHRDRRRPGRLQGQGMADRPDGVQQQADLRLPVPGRDGARAGQAGGEDPGRGRSGGGERGLREDVKWRWRRPTTAW